MAHSYAVLDAETLCVRYSGLVNYGERSVVLPAAARRMRDHAYRNLLVDSTRIDPLSQTPALNSTAVRVELVEHAGEATEPSREAEAAGARAGA